MMFFTGYSIIVRRTVDLWFSRYLYADRKHRWLTLRGVGRDLVITAYQSASGLVNNPLASAVVMGGLAIAPGHPYAG